mmetsp:Transcript_8118/g.12139  ORF Transcript_8118/g.12139 Transcript_8118/m.12139 type:complete len:231 (-) Transcript_8118:223-915(-)
MVVNSILASCMSNSSKTVCQYFMSITPPPFSSMTGRPPALMHFFTLASTSSFIFSRAALDCPSNMDLISSSNFVLAFTSAPIPCALALSFWISALVTSWSDCQYSNTVFSLLPSSASMPPIISWAASFSSIQNALTSINKSSNSFNFKSFRNKCGSSNSTSKCSNSSMALYFSLYLTLARSSFSLAVNPNNNKFFARTSMGFSRPSTNRMADRCRCCWRWNNSSFLAHSS